jgi:VWFA-related protein
VRFEPSTCQGLYSDNFIITGEKETISDVSINGNALALNVSINQVDMTNCPDTIKLYVSVTDRNDNPITGLIESNFTLHEDNVLIDEYPNDLSRNFFYFTSPLTTPLSAALAIDYSGSTQPFINNIVTAAKSFIEQLTLAPDLDPDEAEIIKFAATVELMTGFTSDKAVLDLAIDQDPQLDTTKTAFNEAIWQAINDTSVRNERRAVVVLSDGKNNEIVDHSLDDVVNEGLEKGVPVFTIGVGDEFSPVLQYLSDETGGQYFQTPTYDDLSSVYNQVASLLSNQYLIEYSTTSCGTGAITIEVAVDLLNFDHGEDSISIVSD